MMLFNVIQNEETSFETSANVKCVMFFMQKLILYLIMDRMKYLYHKLKTCHNNSEIILTQRQQLTIKFNFINFF